MTLEELLGDELYSQVKSKIDEANSKETDKLKHIRYADLSEGNYVGKGKFEALNEQLAGKQTELDTANGLIAELKKASKDNEDIQGKITSYESQVAELQAQLQETKIKAALKLSLMSERAVDVDYLSYKLSEKLKEAGTALELDNNDNIKGWSDHIAGLKSQFPTMFVGAGEDGKKVFDPARLGRSDDRNVTPTKEEFRSMTYEQRVALKQENEALYKDLAKN